MTEPAEACTRCGCPAGPHNLVTTGPDPLHGGVILCPTPGCDCYATWSVSASVRELHPEIPEHPRIPDQEEIASLRAMVQAS